MQKRFFGVLAGLVLGCPGTLLASTLYVNLNNPSPASPYMTWGDAATNIQDAVDAATVVGAMVLVTNGVYGVGGRVVYGRMTNRVAVTKPLMVRSVNGPGATLIQGHRLPGAAFRWECRGRPRG